MTSAPSLTAFSLLLVGLLATAWTAQAADSNATATVNVTEPVLNATTGPTANSTDGNVTMYPTLPVETDAPKASLPLEPWLIALICLIVLMVFGLSIWAAARQRMKKQRGKREVERIKAEDAYKVRMEKMSKTIDRL